MKLSLEISIARTIDYELHPNETEAEAIRRCEEAVRQHWQTELRACEDAIMLKHPGSTVTWRVREAAQ